jgi:HEAT repeat protein
MWMYLVVIRRYWAESALTLSGFFAAAFLCSLPFSASDVAQAEARADHRRGCSPAELAARAEQTRALIARSGVEAVPAVLQGVPEEAPFHFETVLALSQLGVPAVPHLAAAVETSEPPIQVVALRALTCLAPRLGAVQAQQLVPTLVRSLQDGSEEVRFATILLLGRINACREAAVPALIAALAEEPSLDAEDDPVYLRQGAAYVLGKIGPAAKPAVPDLTRLLADRGSGVRQEAAIALWRITGDTNAVLPYVRRMFEEADPLSREQASILMHRITRDLTQLGNR